MLDLVFEAQGGQGDLFGGDGGGGGRVAVGGEQGGELVGEVLAVLGPEGEEPVISVSIESDGDGLVKTDLLQELIVAVVGGACRG